MENSSNKTQLSVVIPVYNEEKSIAACLETLKSQSYKDFELIVVDNNCTDKTAEIAKQYGARVVPCVPQGIASARNEGAKQARGDILAFIDADARLSETWIERALDRFGKDQKLDTLSGTNVFDAPGPFTYLYYNFYNVIAFTVLALATFFQYHLVAGNNMLIKRELFLKTPGFPPRVSEDVHFAKYLRDMGNVRSGYDPWMTIEYSSRRFRRNGFLKTIMGWGWALVVVGKEDEYKMDFND